MDAGVYPAMKVLSSTTGWKTLQRYAVTDGPLITSYGERPAHILEVAVRNPADRGTSQGQGALFPRTILSSLRSTIPFI
jgi:hypothetical protein